MPSDHFVPRHYLRRFEHKPGSELIAVTTIVPPRFVGVRGIGGQCCEDGFYENNKGVENLIGTSENDLAPILVDVVTKKDFDHKEMNALKLLAVIFNLRTKKAVEAAKMFPKYYAKSAIEEATKLGQLPSLPEGFSIQDGVDFEGMPAILMHQTIPCLMEAQTLSAKLLKAEQGAFFITSDNPVVVLNQFCVGIDRMRSFAGYGCTGFQLLMPINRDSKCRTRLVNQSTGGLGIFSTSDEPRHNAPPCAVFAPSATF